MPQRSENGGRFICLNERDKLLRLELCLFKRTAPEIRRKVFQILVAIRLVLSC